MFVYLDENNVVREIIPEFDVRFPGIPVEERYTPEFVDNLVYVSEDTEVKEHWTYSDETQQFSPPDFSMYIQMPAQTTEDIDEDMI